MMVVAITACATPYQAKGFAGGYSDYPVGNDSYAISVDVNSYTSMSTAMAYAYRRASELCPRGYDVVDRAGSQSDFYVRNGNVLQNMPKSSVSLIVTCGVQVRPAAIRPAAIRHDDSAWWCTATDAGMDYCERTMAACEDFRAGMATRGVDLAACWPRPDAACFQEQYANGAVGPQCSSTVTLCNKNRDFVVNNPSAGTPLSECAVMNLL